MDAKKLIPWVTYAGLAVAMVGGARWPHPQWPMVAAGVAVLVAAGVWKRRVDGAVDAAPEGATARGSMAASLEAAKALPADVRALVERAEGEGLVEAVEETIRKRVEAIAAGQDDVVRRRGFEAWARLMGPAATAERLLYRAWSAASDGHREEAGRSLREAVGYAEEAAGEAEQLASASAG